MRSIEIYRSKNKVNAPAFDVRIGGVSSTITTPQILAGYLKETDGNAFDGRKISDFTINGADIECNISSPYRFQNDAFNANLDITFYRDEGGLVDEIATGTFAGCSNFVEAYFPEAITLVSDCFQQTGLTEANFPKATTIGNSFANCTNLSVLRFASLISITDSNTFLNTNLGVVDAQSFPVLETLLNANFIGSGLTEIHLPEVRTFGYSTFKNLTTFTTCIAPKLETMDQQVFWNSGVVNLDFPLLTSITNGLYTFRCAYLESLNIPLCTSIGSTTGNNSVFTLIKTGCNITAHTSMQTIDAGNMEGDLLYAQNTRSANITFV